MKTLNKINLKDVMRRYEALKERIVSRKEAAQRFFKFIEEETSWLTCPASTRFHNNVPNGLISHSTSVAECSLRVKELLAPEIPDESVILGGLLHDLGKVGLPGKPFYLPNPNEWYVRNRNMTYIVNPELIAMDSAVRSLYLCAKGGLPLSETEAQAIVAHDGAYVKQNAQYAHSEEPLLLIVSFADGWVAAIEEEHRPLVRPGEELFFNVGDELLKGNITAGNVRLGIPTEEGNEASPEPTTPKPAYAPNLNRA